jgi:DNA-binding MarR family transcriptional regulator
MIRLASDAPPVRRVPNALARRFFQICTTATAECVAGEGLTPLEFAVMAFISPEGGEQDIDQRSLAERLGIDRNNAGLLVERLEEKGLLVRKVNGEDRRARMLRLSPRGRRLWQRISPKASAGQQRILEVLKPADREKLLDLLVKVIEGNWEMARPGTGRRRRKAIRVRSEKDGAAAFHPV